ncbi:50S ribosome-binding GTPase [Streptomyces sp. OfavH-34-F]|uniref:GTPase n=1 Tax=Streptomyces sp. OfavH-34-F TaxID=2917760 RepID=UPI001EF31154|nr:GTPase [Streptomyces sp. OfavH-34-F]MCG7528973.1 50S ribosome-binding GTPase [Streptomyces sp. OfavH-34-F]
MRTDTAVTDAAAGSEDRPGARVLALSARAGKLLAAHPRTRPLTAGLPRADTSPLRVALMGPYSAGKSTLVAALLRLTPSEAGALVDAAPKTQEATPYEWDGTTLVDLPGTQSGDDGHADAARRGVRGADALVIVTTSELPGETETAAILDALGPDGFADRSVVVVNKMSAENSDREVVIGEIRARLGPFAGRVPIVPTDARDYLDALHDPSLPAADRAALVAESGIDALEAELRRVLAPGVAGLRPRAQAYELLRVLADAERRWELDGEELDAALTARRAKDAVTAAREVVLSALHRESGVVADRTTAAGERVAAAVSDKNGTVPDRVARAVEDEEEDMAADFDAKFFSAMRTAFDTLAAEYGTRVPEPDAWAHDLETSGTAPDPAPEEDSPLSRSAKEAAKNGMKAGAAKAGEWFGKVKDGGHGPGSTAAAVVDKLSKNGVARKILDVGGKVTNGAEGFKPWGKTKAAKKLVGAAGKAQWVMDAIGPLTDLAGVVREQGEWKAVNDRRQAIRDRFAEQARARREALTDAGTRYVDEWIARVEQSLAGLTERGTRIDAEREAALTALAELRDEAARLAGPVPS